MDRNQLNAFLEELLEMIEKVREEKGYYFAYGYAKEMVRQTAIAASFYEFGQVEAAKQLNKLMLNVKGANK